MKNFILIATLFLASGTTLLAQKYGHLNYGNVVAMMPETESANKELAEYRQKMLQQGEQMAQSFQSEYASFAQKVQSGNLAPVEQQKLQAALEEQQQELQAFQQDMQNKVASKRQELLQPIVDRVEAAIQEVGDENGFTMIFDTSVFNAVLFAAESQDVLPLVKTKLGI